MNSDNKTVKVLKDKWAGINKETLNELFIYSEGLLFWRHLNEFKKKGAIGNVNSAGYVYISIRKRHYDTHRLIYIMHYGCIEKGLVIDHINNIKTDNRIENLRVATRSQNQANMSITRNNKTGYKGVRFSNREGKYIASIRIDGIHKDLGRFCTAIEASDVYKEACKKQFGDFSKF